MTSLDPPEAQDLGAGDPLREHGRFDKVEALFAGEPPPPPAEAGARIRRLLWLLGVAIPLDVLGIPCCTGVPGAALTIWAWLAVDVEIARVEAGDYGSEDAAIFMRLRSITRWAMVFCVGSLIMQIMLFYTPFYARWWSLISAVLRRLFGP